uniref:Ie-1 n=1 Tax=Cryptophlebia leucotreta granulosis virus TaxID=35254 RepID=A0A2H4ZK83_GVCL|nr:ie-1 [Cryptophlebia leucotreta granulovirus]
MDVENTEDQIMTTNDSENEDSEMEDSEINFKTVSVNNINYNNVPLKMSSKPNQPNEGTPPSPPSPNDDVSENHKWFNKFKTTTCHMFVCHSSIDYVKNERFPAEVYLQKFHSLYGNAFEITIKDSKFYITTKMLQLLKVDSMWYPTESIIKHVDSVTSARILKLRMRDGYTVQQHMVEQLFYVLLIGLGPSDISSVMERINSNKAVDRRKNIQTKYSWRSEERKLKNSNSIINTTQIKNEVGGEKSYKKLFEILYSNGMVPKFVEDKSLNHELYYDNFYQNMLQLKKRVLRHMDCVSNVRLLIKDLVMILYDLEKKNDLHNLKNEDGTEQDVEDFMILSKNYPNGDVIFNMKVRDTNTQRYRINCFKMDNVYVWVNSMVYSDVQRFNLEKMLQKHKWGTHFILQFDYMYNSMLSKLHAEVTKLVIRYILSKRPLELLEQDVKNTKLRYKKIVWN